MTLNWLKRLVSNPPRLPEDVEILAEPREMATATAPVIRRFVWQVDAPDVCAFQNDTYSLNFDDFRMSERFMTAFQYDLRRAARDPNQGVFVLEVGVRIVGFLWLSTYENAWTGQRHGYINNIYVHPDWRRQGLGRLLMGKCEEFFASHDVERIRLTVTCANAGAVALYESMGYQVVRYEMEKGTPEL